MSALTAADIILRPVISEKSIDESGRGKYTFAVHDKANKIQIKAAVEELYAKEKVTVVAVTALPSVSQADDGLSFNVGGVTEYRYRGLTQSRFKPALQGGLEAYATYCHGAIDDRYALLGGQVDAMVTSSASIDPLVVGNQARVLVVGVGRHVKDSLHRLRGE